MKRCLASYAVTGGVELKNKWTVYGILFVFLLLKILAPPTDTSRGRAAALLGLERERVEAIASAEPKQAARLERQNLHR